MDWYERQRRKEVNGNMGSVTDIMQKVYKALEPVKFSSGEKINNVSVSELENMIWELKQAKRVAEERESEERILKERQEQERQERLEREKQEAHVREVTCMDLPLDWNNLYDTDIRTRGVHKESIPDALVYCLNTLGKVDIEYIASITGVDYKTVINTLKGSIYQNPEKWEECFYKGWETAEEHLSGNLMRKWQRAKEADTEYGGYFADNLKAIEKVLPPMVATKDIYVTLGSPWVPPDVIDDFIEYLFGDAYGYLVRYVDEDAFRDKYRTRHDEVTGTWEIPNKSRYNYVVAAKETYGTNRINALHIIENTLNMKTVSVWDEVSCPTNSSGKKRVINQAETVAALEKQRKLIEAFQKWIWSDKQRKERLEKIFENKFSCVKRRNFDGSFLDFPTMSTGIQLHPYQKDAVARIIFTPNTLLAHDVGAGKTYVMIAAGQELKRMGLSTKNMYVVPNNIVGQWKRIFLTMYPEAKLQVVEPRCFRPEKRVEVLKELRDNDCDGILIAYSCFEQIPLSKDYYVEEFREKREMITRVIQQRGKVTSKLKKKKEAIEKAILETAAEQNNSDMICFDELGITRLFVDEAHNFKNVPIETKANMVLGISKGGSKKCQDMMDKVHMVQKKNDGKGVVLATGTPITNSITDVYIMQQYLQSGELAMLDLQSFDSWLGMFAEKTTEFEIDVDTNSYRLATRFSKFHNLPELTSLLASIADFHGVDKSIGVPETDGYSDQLISKTAEFSNYLKQISQRADDVRNGYVSKQEDNMLKITGDGRRAALDLRLVDSGMSFSYQSKVARCAENVADIYFSTSRDKSTQLIFCDTSVPKSGFNIYDELKQRMMLLGVPEEQIAFIHDASTDAKREKLFAKVRTGEVRILLGSTFKLGLGVNVQEKLVALHHIDVPWRPADMTQREGRIIRQGNENSRVKIFRYITEGSFDAYSWQLLETKQRFISDLLSGSLVQRSSSDIADTVLDYAEVKALAVGNPLIKERVEIANELTRYIMLQKKHVETRTRLEQELLELPGRKANQENLIHRCVEDADFYSQWKELHPEPETSQEKKNEAARRQELRKQLKAGVEGNVLQTKETDLTEYCGFRIILPANMMMEKPYVWLKRNGRYYVELGETEVGNLIRIENFLENLYAHLGKLKTGLYKMEEREKDVKAELSKKESYLDQIEEYRSKIDELDEKLGVNKNE